MSTTTSPRTTPLSLQNLSLTSEVTINTTPQQPFNDDQLQQEFCRIYGFTWTDFQNLHGESHLSVNDSSHSGEGSPQDLSNLSQSSNYSHNNPAVQGELLDFNLIASNDGNASVCGRDWDRILCWPETTVGQMASLPCHFELFGVVYDGSKNATRFCGEGLDGGIWNSTNYDLCKPLLPNNPIMPESDPNLLTLTTGVYFCGYCLSLAAVALAMIIFLALKISGLERCGCIGSVCLVIYVVISLIYRELRCLRNTIHTNLILTYILTDTLWIITSFTTFSSSLPDAQVQPGGQGGQTYLSCVTYVLLHYSHMTTFFFMFVEGLYLYVLVVQTFVAENIKLRVYITIGWGIPLAIVIAWVIAKWVTYPGAGGNPGQVTEVCLWLLVGNDYDWIYKAPVIMTLIANTLFLLQIMRVLITKLTSATNPETQQSMKAAKALVVLMPLLGITYLLMLAGIREPVYELIRALMISSQGFLVALLYCFLNGEVRKALRHRWNRIQSSGWRCCNFGRRRRMQQMRDWSPRSRTESIRLYTPSTHNLRKRESTTSEATTMTTINTHCALSSGSGSVNGAQRKLSTVTFSKIPPVLKEEAVAVNTFI